MSSKVKKGTVFEKVAQYLLQEQGYSVDRNVWYKKRFFGPEWHQIDLEYSVLALGISPPTFKVKHIVGECKYSSSGRIRLEEAVKQLQENVRFVKADEGLLITNERMNGSRQRIESETGLRIYDWFALQQIYEKTGQKFGNTWEGLLMKMGYNPAKDHERIERYVPLL